MRSLIVSPQAEDDLAEIWDYIALDSVEVADSFVERLVAQFARLLTYPQIGRARTDLLSGVRYLPFEDYLIFYRVLTDDVEVYRVLPGARDVNGAFEEMHDRD
jgi:toxin ParE1/3/4